jgi:hypothetical protein
MISVAIKILLLVLASQVHAQATTSCAYTGNVLPAIQCDATSQSCCGDGTYFPSCMDNDAGLQCCRWDTGATQCLASQSCCGGVASQVTSYATCCDEDTSCCTAAEEFPGAPSCCLPNQKCCHAQYLGFCCEANEECDNQLFRCVKSLVPTPAPNELTSAPGNTFAPSDTTLAPEITLAPTNTDSPPGSFLLCAYSSDRPYPALHCNATSQSCCGDSTLFPLCCDLEASCCVAAPADGTESSDGGNTCCRSDQKCCSGPRLGYCCESDEECDPDVYGCVPMTPSDNASEANALLTANVSAIIELEGPDFKQLELNETAWEALREALAADFADLIHANRSAVTLTRLEALDNGLRVEFTVEVAWLPKSLRASAPADQQAVLARATEVYRNSNSNPSTRDLRISWTWDDDAETAPTDGSAAVGANIALLVAAVVFVTLGW